MTEKDDNELRETEADVVRIAEAHEPDAVDEIEHIVDQMLPDEGSPSDGSEPSPESGPESVESPDFEMAADMPIEEPSFDDDAVTHEKLTELLAASAGSEEEAMAATKVVDEIARITEAFESMRDSALNEIHNTVRRGEDDRDGLADSLTAIFAEFRAVRNDMIATGRVAQQSLEEAERTQKRVRDLDDRLSVARPVRGSAQPTAQGPFEVPLLLVAFAVILMSWSIVFWIRTGNVTTALIGVVLANVAGVAMLLAPKRR